MHTIISRKQHDINFRKDIKHLYTEGLLVCKSVTNVNCHMSHFDFFTCVICKSCYLRVADRSGLSLQGNRKIKPHNGIILLLPRFIGLRYPGPS